MLGKFSRGGEGSRFHYLVEIFDKVQVQLGEPHGLPERTRVVAVGVAWCRCGRIRCEAVGPETRHEVLHVRGWSGTVSYGHTLRCHDGGL